MWQLFELGALFTSAGQDVVDKFAIIKYHSIDSVVATFHRTVFFLLATITIGLFGVLGPLDFFFNWQVFLFAPFCVAVSLFWTYILRNVEVMTIGAAAYLAPLLFLLIDSQVLEAHFSSAQVIGIVLLALGGVGFSLDGETYRLKSELTRGVGLALLVTVLYNGGEAYFFKYLNAVHGVNGVSFFASLWLLGTICRTCNRVGSKERTPALWANSPSVCAASRDK